MKHLPIERLTPQSAPPTLIDLIRRSANAVSANVRRMASHIALSLLLMPLLAAAQGSTCSSDECIRNECPEDPQAWNLADQAGWDEDAAGRTVGIPVSKAGECTVLFVEEWTSDEASGRIALFTKGPDGKTTVATGRLDEDEEGDAARELPLGASIVTFPNGRRLVRLDMEGSRLGAGFGNSWKTSYFLEHGPTLHVIFSLATEWSSYYVEGDGSDEACWNGEEGRNEFQFLGATTNGWPDIQRNSATTPGGDCPSESLVPASIKQQLLQWDGHRYREVKQ